jgi:N-sulfoglucosamine sulfohydrolase
MSLGVWRAVLFAGVFAAAAAPALRAGTASAPADPTNVLLITVDDMDYGSLGVTGCPLRDITPHIDQLAAGGVLFTHAHVNVAVCQPSRSVLMTGRYPCRNGAVGFGPIREDVPTLGEVLHAAGYELGVLGKVKHLTPEYKYCWDMSLKSAVFAKGRDPEKYYAHTAAFLDSARRAGKPFFLMANAIDPHRPFPGSPDEAARQSRTHIVWPGASRWFKPDEVPVPGFLPDLPIVRQDLAAYFAAVHRADETVGAVLRALRESGLEKNTLVMFMSDNGVGFPFAKRNCYEVSTRTPWIARWPDRADAGRRDEEHMISGVDLMPTVLEALGLRAPDGMDGRSFVPLLRGERQTGRDRVFTMFDVTLEGGKYPMRCVRERGVSYIYNAWADGKNEFRSEREKTTASEHALAYAAGTDPALAARFRMLRFRAREELYDLARDPFELTNRVSDPACAGALRRMRAELLRFMERTGDPLLAKYKGDVPPEAP